MTAPSRPDRLLVLAPTRRAASETFIRANLEGLPFATTAFFGDERPLRSPWRLVYGSAILLSKLLTEIALGDRFVDRRLSLFPSLNRKSISNVALNGLLFTTRRNQSYFVKLCRKCG